MGRDGELISLNCSLAAHSFGVFIFQSLSILQRDMNLCFCFFVALSLVVGQTTARDTISLNDLTEDQREVFDSLELSEFLDEINPSNGPFSVDLLRNVMELYRRELVREGDEHSSHDDHGDHDHGEDEHDDHDHDEDEHDDHDHDENEEDHDGHDHDEDEHDDHDHDENEEDHDGHDHDEDEHDDHDEDEHGSHGNHHEEDSSVLILMPEMLFEHFGSNDSTLTRDQFLESTLMMTSCLRNDQCFLLERDHDDHDDDDDDDTFVIKLIAILVLFFEAVIGATLPIWMGSFKKYEYYLSIVNCFSGGVIFATGVIHLIPHVIEYENEQDGIGDYHLGLVITVFSFGLVFFIEHVLFDVHAHTDAEHVGGDSANHHHNRIEDGGQKPKADRWSALEHSLVLLGATSVHSILEALVVGFEDEAYGVWILFATIAAHKGVTALALGSRFRKAGATLRESIAFAGLFALTAPISILIGTTISDVPNLVNLIFTSLSTGTFLYIGAYEVISEEFHEKHDHVLDPNSASNQAAAKKTRYLKFAAIFLGMVSMSLAALIPHHHAGGHDHDH